MPGNDPENSSAALVCRVHPLAYINGKRAQLDGTIVHCRILPAVVGIVLEAGFARDLS